MGKITARVTPENEQIATAFASPLILRMLGHFNAQQLTEAVNGNLNITKWLMGNPRALQRLKLMLLIIPYWQKAMPHIRSRAWIRWFINNELQHSRGDLYVVFAYNPKAVRWLQRNMVDLSKFLDQNG